VQTALVVGLLNAGAGGTGLQIPERVRALLAVTFTLATARQGKWADVARLLEDRPGLSCAAVAKLCGMSKAAAHRAMRAARAVRTAAPRAG
jgi:hypothetical protein